MSHQERLEAKYENFKNGLRKDAPVLCDFEVGDKVTFTNDYGVSFDGLEVIGFSDDDTFYGRFIHLDTDCYWFPVSPDSIVKS